MTKKGLTEHEQRMASAWLDQELPEGERDYIESRLVEGDAELRDEIEGYRRVRGEFRGWFQKEIETESRKVNLWAAIEKDLTKKKGFDWSALAEKFISTLMRPAFGGGLVAAAAVALLVFSFSSSSSFGPANNPDQLAQRDALEIERLQGAPPQPFVLGGNRVEPDLLSRVGIGSSHGGRVPESLAVRLMNSPQLIVDNQNRDGGFRAGNTDIEWIKTNKPFKLVQSRRRQAPPVIWVARTNK